MSSSISLLQPKVSQSVAQIALRVRPFATASANAVPNKRPGVCCAAADLVSRRGSLIAGVSALVAAKVEAAQAIGFQKDLKKKRKIPEEEYSVLEANGLQVYDLAPGNGSTAAMGDRVVVHFDCYYRNIDAVSSRYSALLGKNEIIPEPFEFVVGKPVNERKARKVDGGQAGGSFSGLGGPKPPPALSLSVIGMKKGGRRSVIVPPEVGYGDKGQEEIPPGATFEMQIELLEVYKN